MSTTGTDTYTATIPGAAAGHLIRYRVEATNTNGTNRSPRADDTINYRGMVVPSGISSPIPVLEWFISDADYNAMVSNPTADITRSAVLAYGGVVIDNVEANIKGHASQNDPKVSWKFHTPQNYDLAMPGILTEPVDEFDMQADWSDKSHGRSILSWEAYQRAGVVNHQMFPIRTQRNGAFQGLYNFNEVFDGTWRKREGYDDKEVYAAETSAFSASRPANVRFTKENPDDTNYASLSAFLNGVNLTGNAQRDFLLANADLPQDDQLRSRHRDRRPRGLVVEELRSRAEPDDRSLEDHPVGPRPHPRQRVLRRQQHVRDAGRAGRHHQRADAGPARRPPVARHVLPPGADPGQRHPRHRAHGGALRREASGRTVDRGAGLRGLAVPERHDVQRRSATRLFNEIQARRNVFNSDARVPGNQPAAPDMVIDEIQHSPTAGDTAEFVELYNPNSQAIDLSGWSLTGGAIPSFVIQPGTVILPHATMTFASNDPAFRAAYGSTVFVGDRYTGNLPATGTLTLTRPDDHRRRHRHLRRRRLAHLHDRAVPRAGQPGRRQQRPRQLGPVHRLRHPRHRPPAPDPSSPHPAAPTIGTATARERLGHRPVDRTDQQRRLRRHRLHDPGPRQHRAHRSEHYAPQEPPRPAWSSPA